MATKAGAILKRSYDDFEPFCKLQTEEGKDILKVHLHGFKKEQLRVQINNARVLTINGERPVDGTKWSRFRKETNVSKDCKTNEIRAKFSGGILYITMPTRIPLIPSQVQPTLLGQQNQENGKPKLESLDTNQDKVTKDFIAKELGSKEKSSVSELKLGKKIVVKVAVAVVVVVAAIGWYVTYKYRQCSHTKN